jgi:enamine deaminase RidA (YjgF/YER057c/UK114 family)
MMAQAPRLGCDDLLRDGSGCEVKEASDMTLDKLNPPALPIPTGYSQIVAATGSRLVFVAGQVALDAEGRLVAPGDVVGQARQAFANLLTAIEAAGASIDDVAKITWYVVGYRPELLPELAAARNEALQGHAPASTLVGVSALAQPHFLIEVEAVAVID